MKTSDLFKANRSAQRLNESLEKTFGKKLDLASIDLPKLEDARNKIRTQQSQVRGQSGFNETIENEAVTQAQWMLDAINAEIAEREEFIADPHVAEVSTEEDQGSEGEETLAAIAAAGDDGYDMIQDGMDGLLGTEAQIILQDMYDDVSREYRLHPDDDFEQIFDRMMDRIESDYGSSSKGQAGFGQEEAMAMEKAPPGAKAERMVKHIKQGYAKDGKLTDKEKSIAYATAWKQHNKEKGESVDEADELARRQKSFKKDHLANKNNASEYKQKDDPRYKGQYKIAGPKGKLPENKQGEDMRNLNEGEVQQASAIVTAKTMVDRVSRWIEELSGMENDTLLQLGDSIRDEMGQEQAKGFISAVAPAIQQALENLKQTRETLATGVRSLTGEEQPAEMLGGEPGGDEVAPAAPDEMNLGEPEAAPEGGEDEFAAAEPAAGGLEASGREQRESIEYSNRLLKVLAG